MRVPVDVEQLGRIHRRVDLRRRQAGVAEQFLKRPQVRAARQQVRSEAVAKRMRRQAVRQAEPSPRRCDGAADQVGVERPAPRARGTMAYPARRPRALSRRNPRLPREPPPLPGRFASLALARDLDRCARSAERRR